MVLKLPHMMCPTCHTPSRYVPPCLQAEVMPEAQLPAQAPHPPPWDGSRGKQGWQLAVGSNGRREHYFLLAQLFLII